MTKDKETQKIEMKDAPILKNIKVQKVDEQTGETIISNKFVFALYEDEECTNLIKTVEANIDEGTASFNDMRYGTVAYIKEYEAPTGYKLSDRIVKVEINENGVFIDGELVEESDNTCSFIYYNEQLPKIQTGDSSSIIPLIILIVSATLGIIIGVAMLISKRNKNDIRKKYKKF